MASLAESRDIVLATVGRFHYATLADQLHERGRLQCLFSGYPRSHVRCASTPASRIRTRPWLQTLGMVMPGMWGLGDGLSKRVFRSSEIDFDQYVARNLPDCAVYSAMSGGGVVSGAEAKRRGIRYVCERSSSHIVDVEQQLRAEYDAWGLKYGGTDSVMIERELQEYEQADRIVLLSEASRQSFIRQGYDVEKVRVVNPDVAATLTSVEAIQDRTRQDRKLNLLFVGQCSVRKGFGHLLHAFSRLGAQRANLRIIGAESPEAVKLKSGVDLDGVQFLGNRAHAYVAQAMDAADAVLVPSIEDGFCLVVVEALSRGCPVIVSDQTGASQVVRDGVNGLLVSVQGDGQGHDQSRDGFTDRLSAALSRLLEEEDLLPRLRQGVQDLGANWNDGSAYADRWLAAVS